MIGWPVDSKDLVQSSVDMPAEFFTALFLSFEQ